MDEAQQAAVVAAARRRLLRYSEHALRGMREHGIPRRAIFEALVQSTCEMVEDYPTDPRGASCLMIGWVSGRALHVVLSYPPRPIVITVYWPDSQPNEWTSDFRKRLSR
jgi:hypothetical protein